MNIPLCLLCFLILPSCVFLEKSDDQVDESILKDIVFPKDRINYPLPRVVGGEETIPHHFSYQAALYVYMAGGTFFCGGTLISPSWVLTAAHCISENPIYISVILGSHDLTAAEPSRLRLNSTTFVYHEGWSASTFQNDIGLIKLPINVTMSENITTIRYARGSNLYTDLIGTILGWGLTETGGSSVSPVLRHVNVSIISNEDCLNVFQSLIVPSHLCTSGTGIVGSCSGDSGGPLVVDGVQVGIVSFGSANCNLGYPSVFARVTHYTDWIGQYVTDGGNRNIQNSLAILTVFCLLQLFVSL